MKMRISMLIVIALLLSSFPFSACATEIPAEDVYDAYAVICDKDGNIIDNLEVDVSVSEISKSRSTGTTYAVTYTTRETKADGSSNYLDGVTATGTITWNDIGGTTNLLVGVSGNWITGSQTISSRSVIYSASDINGSTIVSYTKNPPENIFEYEEPNCTGYKFYLHTYATIDSTGNTIALHAWSKATTA